jgi:2-keto-4-pentenoate hydratase/2-oxohepta-3-ene-1,7-dioic acid hydratase in catechol pathway
MRLASFEHDGRPGLGIVRDDGIIDLRRHGAGGARGLRDALRAGNLTDLERFAGRAPDLGFDEIRFLPVVHDPAARIFCVGVNYLPHIREMGREPPAYPVVFVRFATSLVGHREPMVRPVESGHYDYEGELAVIIGARGRRVDRDRALRIVAGYSCFNDGSLRDFQRHSGQFTPGKNFDRSGAFGPWMVTADELPDLAELDLQTRLNGSLVQAAKIGELCFDVSRLIEYISLWTALEPGDVIVTGTPGGVGAARTPPLWMKAGDRVEVEISGIGVLSNPVVDETRD